MVSRADRSPIAVWIWTVDRWMLAIVLALMCLGLIISFAASPQMAERLGIDSYHFVRRQIMFVLASVGILLAISTLSSRRIFTLAMAIFIVSTLLLALTHIVGIEVKGARRWLSIGGFSLQPSEFVKPSFIVVAAYLICEVDRLHSVSGRMIAPILFTIVAALMISQPDLGQTLLLGAVFSAMYFVAGISWLIVILLIICCIAAFFAAYSHFPHVAARIDRYMDPSYGDNYQVNKAVESILSGGWWGRGPGEGTIKRVLPDSHTDFVFAVVGEEFGILVCLTLVGLFALLVLYGIWRSSKEEEPFARLASAGLIMLVGLQAFTNIAVNINLIPTKGMTLPFVSYGGSSLLSLSFCMGIFLALTRKKVGIGRYHRMARGFRASYPQGTFL